MTEQRRRTKSEQTTASQPSTPVALSPVKTKMRLVIGDGKSFTSKRGILGPGTEVTESDFTSGKEVIEKFVKSGHIIEVPYES